MARRVSLLVVAILIASFGVATPAAAEEPPSWAEIEAARNSESAAQTLVSRIEASLADAEARSAEASTAAIEAATIATAAFDAEAAASQRAADLTTTLDETTTTYDVVRGQLTTLAVTRSRTGTDGPLVTQLLTSADPDTLLQRLGLLDKLTGTWSSMLQDASARALVMQSLTDQASAAEDARVAASQAAQVTASEAQARADAEASAVTALAAEVDTLYAQLAALRGTTADLERRARLAQQTAEAPTNQAPAPQTPSNPSTPSQPTTPTAPTAPTAPTTPVPPTYGVVVDPAAAKEYARGAIGSYGWGDDQFQCLVLLWNRESGWRANATNPSSGAYGIPQAWPADKLATAGADWRTNAATQINWGLSYINSRYGSPCGAWDHSERIGWY